MMKSNRDVRILMVDDDVVDRKSLRRAFAGREIDIPVEEASDGAAALEFLRDSEANGKPAQQHLVLLDLNMPRMNGIEFLERLRSDDRLSSMVVFVLTTSRAEKDRSDAYRHNVAGYIVKSDAGDGFAELVDLLAKYVNAVELPPPPSGT
jgi:CheY-like chemotaxis protein